MGRHNKNFRPMSKQPTAHSHRFIPVKSRAGSDSTPHQASRAPSSSLPQRKWLTPATQNYSFSVNDWNNGTSGSTESQMKERGVNSRLKDEATAAGISTKLEKTTHQCQGLDQAKILSVQTRHVPFITDDLTFPDGTYLEQQFRLTAKLTISERDHGFGLEGDHEKEDKVVLEWDNDKRRAGKWTFTQTESIEDTGDNSSEIEGLLLTQEENGDTAMSPPEIKTGHLLQHDGREAQDYRVDQQFRGVSTQRDGAEWRRYHHPELNCDLESDIKALLDVTPVYKRRCLSPSPTRSLETPPSTLHHIPPGHLHHHAPFSRRFLPVQASLSSDTLASSSHFSRLGAPSFLSPLPPVPTQTRTKQTPASHRAFILPPFDHAPPSDDALTPPAFSPHRRGRKFVSGGMAETMAGCVIEAAQNVHPQWQLFLYAKEMYGRTSATGDTTSVEAAGIGLSTRDIREDPGMLLVRGTMDGGRECYAVLVGKARGRGESNEVEKGQKIEIWRPWWDIELPKRGLREGGRWIVSVEWSSDR